MVLDEDALEAMLNRGREAPEQDRPETVRTDQTEEYEVYERKELAEEAAAEAADAPPTQEGPPAGDPMGSPDHQAPRPETPRSRYVQEAPREEPSAQPPAPASHEERPTAPERPPEPEPRPAPPEPRTPEPEPSRQERPPAPSEDHSPTEPQQQAFRPEAAGSTTQTRRPQVWPPVHHDEAEATTAPETPTSGPTEAPDTTPQTSADTRTHNPTANEAPTTQTRGDGCRIAVVQALFNQELTDMMADLAVSRARKRGAEVTHHVTVPGVFDLPLTAKRMAEAEDVDAVVVIGCVIQGETTHDELITHATAKTLQEVSLETGVPIGFGVIGPGMTWEQAEARVVNGKHAVEAALAQWKALQTM